MHTSPPKCETLVVTNNSQQSISLPLILCKALLPTANFRYQLIDPEGTDNLVSYDAFVRIDVVQSHCTIKSRGSSGNSIQLDGPKTLPMEPTAPYITGGELNLRKLQGQAKNY